MTSRLLAVSIALGLGVLPGPGRVFAQPLQVTPIQAELTSGSKSTILTLHNLGSDPMRFQVSALAWQQDSRGEMKLSPTKDVAFFPSLLTVGPGDKRNLRVAAAAPFGSTEKTYRVFIEQLPERSGDPQNAIRMLTRVGIPVFFAPAKPSPGAELGALALDGRKLSFALRNTGNVRLRPQAVRLLGRDGGGAVVFEQPLPAWYVLAGGERLFEVEVPADRCSRVRTISAEAQLSRRTLSAELATPGGACAR